MAQGAVESFVVDLASPIAGCGREATAAEAQVTAVYFPRSIERPTIACAGPPSRTHCNRCPVLRIRSLLLRLSLAAAHGVAARPCRHITT